MPEKQTAQVRRDKQVALLSRKLEQLEQQTRGSQARDLVRLHACLVLGAGFGGGFLAGLDDREGSRTGLAKTLLRTGGLMPF